MSSSSSRTKCLELIKRSNTPETRGRRRIKKEKKTEKKGKEKKKKEKKEETFKKIPCHFISAFYLSNNKNAPMGITSLARGASWKGSSSS
jgi:hypothetical protein